MGNSQPHTRKQRTHGRPGQRHTIGKSPAAGSPSADVQSQPKSIGPTCPGCAVLLEESDVAHAEGNHQSCRRCGVALSAELLPLQYISLAVFYESLPVHMRHPPNVSSSPPFASMLQRSSSRSVSKSAASSISIASSAAASPPPPPLPHTNLSTEVHDALMAEYILPQLRSMGKARLEVGQLLLLPLSPSFVLPSAQSTPKSSCSSPLPPMHTPTPSLKAHMLRLKVVRAFPSFGYLQLPPAAQPRTLPPMEGEECKGDQEGAAAALDAPPSLPSTPTEVTLQRGVFSLTRPLHSVTLLPLESSATKRAVPLPPDATQSDILLQYLKPHFQKHVKHRHLYEGYIFVAGGVQFKVAMCQPSDGCLNANTDIYSYFHPLKELTHIELTPVVSDSESFRPPSEAEARDVDQPTPEGKSSPANEDDGRPTLPKDADEALAQYLRPYFRANNFGAFTRESIIVIPSAIAPTVPVAPTPMLEGIPLPLASSIVAASPSSLTYWKITQISPAIGGLVTGCTEIVCVAPSTGMPRVDYLKRQAEEDGEYALLVQKQQALRCVEEDDDRPHRHHDDANGSPLDEWEMQQRLAVQLRDRLSLALARMQGDQRHVLWQQVFEQLDQLAAMKPGSIPLRHFANLLANAQQSLGVHSDLINGASPAEISSLPTREFKPAAESVIGVQSSENSEAEHSMTIASRMSQAPTSKAPRPPISTKKRRQPKVKELDDSKTCQICLADYQKGELIRSLPCFHAYHKACIDVWLKKSRNCPSCRADLS